MSAPAYAVVVGREAKRDLSAAVTYLIAHDAADRAALFLAELRTAFDSLAQWPKRGAKPRELKATAGYDVRQLNVGVFRVIYVVQDEVVTVLMVVDGRRDVGSLLTERLKVRPQQG